jgi:hypothetical protein
MRGNKILPGKSKIFFSYILFYPFNTAFSAKHLQDVNDKNRKFSPILERFADR